MTPASPRSARRRWALLLFVVFIVFPLLELYVVIQVGSLIGVWPTIALLVVDSLIGAWLLKREGMRAWRALRARLDAGRMPGTELADGVLVVFGGALMLTPGFVTDALGILLILPFTRPLFRRLVTAWTAHRVSVTVAGGPVPGARRSPGPSAGDAVVRGEVIDDES